MEDYLEAVYILFQKQGDVRCVDVAEYLEVTKPSVSRAVKELTKAKYLRKDSKRHTFPDIFRRTGCRSSI